MRSLLTENKAGQFAARCRKGHWVEFDQLPTDQATTTSRWDNKLKANVFLAQCAFDTTDRAVFVAHMRAAHGAKVSHGLNGPWAKTIKPWRGPKLNPEGTAWVDKLERTQTCPSCGLVAEVDQTHAAELWWTEHERGCALARSVAS